MNFRRLYASIYERALNERENHEVYTLDDEYNFQKLLIRTAVKMTAAAIFDEFDSKSFINRTHYYKHIKKEWDQDAD